MRLETRFLFQRLKTQFSLTRWVIIILMLQSSENSTLTMTRQPTENHPLAIAARVTRLKNESHWWFNCISNLS